MNKIQKASNLKHSRPLRLSFGT